MPRPWELLDRVDTPTGRLELRRRGALDFMISVNGRVLMSSLIHRTEVAVAELACKRIAQRKAPRVLIGGLGLGFTLRAALDALPLKAEVVVAELSETVVQWCRGPAEALTEGAIDDSRVRVHVGDVTQVIRAAARDRTPFDAIILDLYEGPSKLVKAQQDPLYGGPILAKTHAALTPEVGYAVWAEDPNKAFERRLERTGFRTELVRCGRGGPRHAVYLATG